MNTLQAATVELPGPSRMFSSHVTHPVSPLMTARTLVRMNCRCCGLANSVAHDAEMEAQPFNVDQPGCVHDASA